MNNKDFYKNYYSDVKLSDNEKRAMLNDLHNQLSCHNSPVKSAFFKTPQFKAVISFALSVCIITSAISYSQYSHRHDILINYNDETTGTAIGHTAVSEYSNSENIINSDTSDYAYFETTDMDFYGTKGTSDIYITDFFTDITNISDITENSKFSDNKNNSENTENAVTTQPSTDNAVTSSYSQESTKPIEVEESSTPPDADCEDNTITPPDEEGDIPSFEPDETQNAETTDECVTTKATTRVTTTHSFPVFTTIAESTKNEIHTTMPAEVTTHIFTTNPYPVFTTIAYTTRTEAETTRAEYTSLLESSVTTTTTTTTTTETTSSVTSVQSAIPSQLYEESTVTSPPIDINY